MTRALDFFVRPDEQCVALTSTFRLIQRIRGHRYSVDDMLVAYVASTRVRQPSRVLDLGYGLGSVMLMLAWRYPSAHFVGVEAQPEHVALARRNVLLNDCESRATVFHADLRSDLSGIFAGALSGAFSGIEERRLFDLVTATPPYFDPRSATMCADPQRAHAQWELRGGIEDYALAASKVLGEDGCFVTCSAAKPEGRAERAFEWCGFSPLWRCDVLPSEGALAFLSLWIAARNAGSVMECESPLVLRKCNGDRTLEHIQIREAFGISCSAR